MLKTVNLTNKFDRFKNHAAHHKSQTLSKLMTTELRLIRFKKIGICLITYLDIDRSQMKEKMYIQNVY